MMFMIQNLWNVQLPSRKRKYKAINSDLQNIRNMNVLNIVKSAINVRHQQIEMNGIGQFQSDDQTVSTQDKKNKKGIALRMNVERDCQQVRNKRKQTRFRTNHGDCQEQKKSKGT